MRVLIVGFPQSIHVARGVELISELGWDVHLFPSKPVPPHPALRDVTVHLDGDVQVRGHHPSVRVERLTGLSSAGQRILPGRSVWRARAQALSDLVRELRPDLLHSKEIQHAGYLTLEARRRLDGAFPPWLVHNWGSDIYYYGRIPRHAEKIRAVMRSCDYYWAECHRDVALARAFGFRGRVLPVLPITGGYDLERAERLRRAGPTSGRRTIALRASAGPFDRTHAALSAIERCAAQMRGHTLALYLATDSVRAAAERLCSTHRIGLEVISTLDAPAPHEEILALHGRSRVSIALKLSDAICTSFLDALVMGSLPIQSRTSCAPEWAARGGALFVAPLDEAGIEAALRRALGDDLLVDSAAAINRRTAARQLDRGVVRSRWLDAYERIAAEASGRSDALAPVA